MLENDILVDAIGEIRDEFILEAAEKTEKRHKKPFPRLIAAAAAAVLCIFAAVPALAAADVEIAYQTLYAVAPAAAQRLKPVNSSCVEHGIQMEVVSAKADGSRADVLIAMKDLEGDRLDETADLFDSYTIRTAHDSIGSCAVAEYDKSTGTAVFLVNLTNMDGEDMAGEKVTFSVSRLLSGKNIFKGSIDYDLRAVVKAPETAKNVVKRGGGGKYEEIKALLEPNETPLAAIAPGASLSAAGYPDGMLHVQMYYEDILHTDNHGWLRLENEEGDIVECIGSVSFWDEDKSGSYEDYVFAITPETAADYRIYGEFTTCSACIEGDWQVTFPLENVK